MEDNLVDDYLQVAEIMRKFEQLGPIGKNLQIAFLFQTILIENSQINGNKQMNKKIKNNRF